MNDVFPDSARWIGTPLLGTGLTAAPAPMLRRHFTLPVVPAQATLTITALGLYEAYLNGQRIGDVELRPGWTDYNKRLHVQTYDVTHLLQQGDNTLGAWLGDGWYAGKVAHFDRGMKYGWRPLLRAALRIVGADGSATLIATDEHWCWLAGPIRSADLMDGEHYDARLAVDDWCHAAATESDAQWHAVELPTPDPLPALAVSPAPPVRITEQLSPTADPTRIQDCWSRARWVYDFGQNFTGKVTLRVKGPRGATVQLRYAEVLTPGGGAVDTSNLRSCIATDSYTLRGDAEGETWTPRFTFHGFRYVELLCHKQHVKADQPDSFAPFGRDTLTGLVMHNDMPRIGAFETGYELVNRLQSNIVWGLRSNFLEVPTDCPQRDERLGWTGDAQVFAPTALFNYSAADFFRKWMGDVADSQGSDGSIPSVAPSVIGSYDGGAGWSDAVVVVPWEAYRATGDQRLLEESYDTMRRWAQFQVNTARDGVRGDPEHGIFPGYGDWLALDNDSNNPMDNASPKALVGTAYHAYSQGLLSRIATILGRDADAEHARRAREAAVAAFRRLYVTDGRVNVRSQTAHLMALAFDLLPEAQHHAVFDDLLTLLAERNHHLTTGFLGTPLLCPVLTRFGRIDLACDLLLTETYPGWLYPITLGATTMWERWNSWHPERGFVEVNMNSLNHYAYGAVGDWMYRNLAGIDLDLAEDAGPQLVLRPYPDRRLGHCHAQLDSAVGVIESRWTIVDDEVTYEVVVPEGIKASLQLPGQEPNPLASGEHRVKAAL